MNSVKKMSLLLKGLAILPLISISNASVSEEESGFTLTPMIGFTRYSGESDLQESGNVSIAFGYKFASPWALELAYLNADTETETSGTSIDIDQFRLDGLYYTEEDGITRPYFVLGAGEVNFDADGQDDTDTMVNAGVGVKFRINQLASIRTDVRAIQLLDEDSLDLGFNLGVQFFFGKSSGSSARPAPIQAKKKVLDDDNDGIPNGRDNCPSTAAGVAVDATGCEIKKDSDGDGVFDSSDQCPGTKARAKVDERGCYILIKEDVTVSLNVNFANNSEEIVSGSEQIKDVADFMNQYPLTRVEIEGHTDSRGAAAYNQQLSQRRANAVAETLVDRYNVAASRVKAVGYGETRPVASNDTADGRAKNRRVSAVVKATVEKVAE